MQTLRFLTLAFRILLGFGLGWLLALGVLWLFSIDWNSNAVAGTIGTIVGLTVLSRIVKRRRIDRSIATPPYRFTQGMPKNIGKRWSGLSEGERALVLEDYRSAQRWIASSNYSYALGVLNRAVLVYSYFSRAIDDMGSCYFEQGNVELAGECWKTAGAIKRLGWEQPRV